MPLFFFTLLAKFCFLAVNLQLLGADALMKDDILSSRFDTVIKDRVKTHLSTISSIDDDVYINNNHCVISEYENCSISTFQPDSPILVFPGGETRCIESSTPHYAFQVIPGDLDKLVFYFQGGGACWDQWSFDSGFCLKQIAPQSLIGVFDRTDESNVYRSYTIVHINYCSGDSHSGNATAKFQDSTGAKAELRGIINTQSVLDWVSSQVASGGLSDSFSDLVIMGCSAGSIGAQVWAARILNSFVWHSAAVIPDSYVGVFPKNTFSVVVSNIGLCDSIFGFLNVTNQAKCNNQDLTISDVTMQNMAMFPNVPFAFIQSKIDNVQISFYLGLAYSFKKTPFLSTSTYYDEVNGILSKYNHLPNFVVYLINGDQHCFTDTSVFYTADAISATDDGTSEKSPPSETFSSYEKLLAQWTFQMPLVNGTEDNLISECYGDIIAEAASGSSTTYCDPTVVPKTFGIVPSATTPVETTIYSSDSGGSLSTAVVISIVVLVCGCFLIVFALGIWHYMHKKAETVDVKQDPQGYEIVGSKEQNAAANISDVQGHSNGEGNL